VIESGVNMLTPNILDIATQDVVSIADTKTIKDAIELMYAHRHRDVIILPTNSSHYSILTASDLIKLKLQNINFDTPIKEIKFSLVSTVLMSKTVAEALTEIDSETTCLCVIDGERKLRGFVSYFDMLSSIDPQLMLKKRVISEIMVNNRLKFVNINTKTIDAISLMETSTNDCIVLVDNHKNAKGILTTKDIIKIFGENKDLNQPLHEYMSSPVQTIKSDTTISDALQFVQDKHFKRLIVEDFSGEITGQITQEELLARVYSKWADILKTQDNQLNKVNQVLKARANKFEDISSHDTLTGAYNREKFEEALGIEIEKTSRYGTESFVLIFLDIDNFKTINDTHGHLVGDEVLKELATRVRKNLRKSDLFARWGGEEFVLILPLISRSNATIAAQNIRKHISETDFQHVGKVTCSFGLTKYTEGDTIHSIIHRADLAMYEAKNTGRNKVISIENERVKD